LSMLDLSPPRFNAASFPLIVLEQDLLQFCWYLHHEKTEAMLLEGEVYNFLRRFNATEQEEALDLIAQLSTHGRRVVMSVNHSTKTQYRVWVDIRDWFGGLAR
jgi:hypothetical protein